MRAAFGMFIVMAITLLGTGCHHQEPKQEKPEQLTLGTVQKRIEVGMSQADVAEALGMPNIVTKDSRGKEAWIYDKMASEVSYSRDSGGMWLILGAFSKDSGAALTSQKTLTVVIKFSDANTVDDVTYHSTQF